MSPEDHSLAVELAANTLHEAWKLQHIAQRGNTPRWKPLNRESQDWFDTQPERIVAGTLRNNPETSAPEIDIAALPNSQLPPQYSSENRDAAGACIRSIDMPDVELMASWVHEEWRQRHHADPYADQALMVDYYKLPEAEKEKDRAIVRACIAAVAHTMGAKSGV